MSAFASFAVAIGSLFCGLVVIATWTFRTSAAPLWVKIALPVLLTGAAVYAPFAFRDQLGRPIPSTLAEMPERINLLAFKPVDSEKRVDLWIDEGGATRAYEIPLDKKTAAALRQAMSQLARGRPAFLSKSGRAASGRAKGSGGKHAAKGVTDIIGDDHPGYVLKDDLQPTLPPKD